jgi:hypothetical protein
MNADVVGESEADGDGNDDERPVTVHLSIRQQPLETKSTNKADNEDVTIYVSSLSSFVQRSLKVAVVMRIRRQSVVSIKLEKISLAPRMSRARKLPTILTFSVVIVVMLLAEDRISCYYDV